MSEISSTTITIEKEGNHDWKAYRGRNKKIRGYGDSSMAALKDFLKKEEHILIESIFE